MDSGRAIRHPGPVTTRRVLTIHGTVVGIGWFLVALPSLLAIQMSITVQDWFAGLAPAVQGVLGTIVVVTAFPLLWPVYLAIGLYETQTASQLDSAEAAQGARRVVTAQALLTILATVAAAILGLTYRGFSAGEYLALAWLPLLAIALGHLWTRRCLNRPNST